MAERKPLVLIDGRLKELPDGDTTPGATAQAASLIDDAGDFLCDHDHNLLTD